MYDGGSSGVGLYDGGGSSGVGLYDGGSSGVGVYAGVG